MQPSTARSTDSAWTAGQLSSERFPIGRNDPAALTHAGRGIHYVEGDLPSMQI
jgi:hypothetical protein